MDELVVRLTNTCFIEGGKLHCRGAKYWSVTEDAEGSGADQF